MNLGCKDGLLLAQKFAKNLKKNKSKDFIILPSIQTVYYIKEKIKTKTINIGAQDCSKFDAGAFTGDVSANMIKELGCEYVLLGHSERRSNYHENKEVLKKKIKHAVFNKLKIIFCVGETLSEYESSLTKKTIQNQLTNLFNNISNFDNLIIAYEPVWAIGTKKTPSLEEINNVHTFIKKLFQKKYKVENICVIYGGSVNFENSKAIFSVKNVDGGLIGGASLKADEFKKIYDNLN